MEITTITIILALLALLVSGPVAWVVKSQSADIRFLTKLINDHKLHVAEVYVTHGKQTELKNDMTRQLAEIKEMIKHISTMIESNPRHYREKS